MHQVHLYATEKTNNGKLFGHDHFPALSCTCWEGVRNGRRIPSQSAEVKCADVTRASNAPSTQCCSVLTRLGL